MHPKMDLRVVIQWSETSHPKQPHTRTMHVREWTDNKNTDERRTSKHNYKSTKC